MKYRYAIKDIDKKKTAKAVGISRDISAKHSKEVCDLLRNKNAEKSVTILKEVIEMKRAVPYKRYKRDLAHKTKMGPGRYPVQTSKVILKILNNAINNAENKGLSTSDLYIKHICAHLASRPWHYGRHRRRKMKRAHVEIVLEERAVDEKEPKNKIEIKEKKEKKATKKQKDKKKPKKSDKKKKEKKDKAEKTKKSSKEKEAEKKKTTKQDKPKKKKPKKKTTKKETQKKNIKKTKKETKKKSTEKMSKTSKKKSGEIKND